MKIRISIFSLIFAVFTFGFQPARADFNEFIDGVKTSFLNCGTGIADSFGKLGFGYDYLTPIFAWTFGKKALGSLNRARLSRGLVRKKGILGFAANAMICGWSLLKTSEIAKRNKFNSDFLTSFLDSIPSVTKSESNKE